MEDKDLTQKIDVILQKRVRCEQLTDEENLIVTDVVNKLLAGKQCVNKTVTVKTGEEIRKGDAKLPVSAKEPNRDFKGAFDSKVKIESTGDTPDPAKMPKQIRDEKLTDQKEEKVATEDTSGKIKADYVEEEFADLDNKPRDVNYEEDRRANISEGQHDYKGSIRTKGSYYPGDLVTKSYSGGRKMVGAIVKVYPPVKGQQGILVKWSDGRWEPVNIREVELLKADKEKVMETKDIKKPEVAVEKKFEKPVDSKDAKKPDVKDGKKPFPPTAKDDKKTEVVPPKDEKQSVSTDAASQNPTMTLQHKHLGEKHGLEMKHLGERHGLEREQAGISPNPEQTASMQGAEVQSDGQVQDDEQVASSQLPEEPPQEWMQEVMNTLRQLTDLSDQEIEQAARASWVEIVAGHNNQSDDPQNADAEASNVATQKATNPATSSLKTQEDNNIPFKKDALPMASSEVKSPKDTTVGTSMPKTTEVKSVEKGEAPPSKWMENCKAALERDNADVENPFAICTASYQKMKNKGVIDGDIVKISVEDMKEICPSCAEKMVQSRIKFYKVTVSDYNKLV